MKIPTLTNTEQRLVTQMRNAEVARWAINVSEGAFPFIYRVMASFLREEHTYQGTQALVVGPAGNMHKWWDGGWGGEHLSSIKFMHADMPAETNIGIAAFDRQPEYPQKYLDKLTAFLQEQAPTALFLLPKEPSVELGRILAAQRFVHLNVK